MSKLDDTRKEITQRVATALAASPYAATPFFYTNMKVLQPKNAMWGLLSIIWGDGLQADLGPNPTERYENILQFDVIVPEESGTKAANDFGEFLAKIFSRTQFYASAGNSIVFRVPSYTWSNRTDAGTQRLIVRIPFRRDEKT